MRTFYVYILASNSRVLYVGVTNDLIRRVHEHRSGAAAGFTRQYQVHQLVYYETVENSYAAITREKQIKSWRREKKLALVERDNPGWADLLPAPVEVASPVIPKERSDCDPARACHPEGAQRLRDLLAQPRSRPAE